LQLPLKEYLLYLRLHYLYHISASIEALYSLALAWAVSQDFPLLYVPITVESGRCLRPAPAPLANGDFRIHLGHITCCATTVLRQIRGASAAPFRASPRVHRSQHLISWNLLLLQHDHVRPLPTRSLDSCSLLTTQLSVLSKIW
jgi:hypothetical protein